MRSSKRYRLFESLPASSQSDIAFLLIIFFIVSAIFFERTGLIFTIPHQKGKDVIPSDRLVTIKLFNDHILWEGKKLSYSQFEEYPFENLRSSFIRFSYSPDLRYERFIEAFNSLKQVKDLKVSFFPLKEK
ncbi:MAG: biopolymer transporter ExbD [Spirochaetes bacterium]|nr:biopolymer transporter ExbD [Spirochaetota bacterium]